MDFRRSNRHFQLSSDPRQPTEQPVAEQVVPAVETQQIPTDAKPDYTPEVETIVQSVDFVPPPPVPESVPPVIEPTPFVAQTEPTTSEQLTVEPDTAPTNEPSPVPLPATPRPVPMTAPATTVPLTKPFKSGRSVPLKFVILGSVLFLILLAGSIYIQQTSIAELKTERELQATQLKEVNPISVGAGASEEEVTE